MAKLIGNSLMTSSQCNFKLISSFKDAKRLWAEGKLIGFRSLTNFYLPQRAIERATDTGKLWGYAVPGASVLIRRDRDFFHTYMNFSDTTKAQFLLNDLPGDEIFVADVLQRGSSHQSMLDILKFGGFTPYRELNRIQRLPQSMAVAAHKVDIRLAGLADADHILISLESNFDRFSEQLPEINELYEAIGNNQILIALSDGHPAGFLFFELVGASSIVRYWYVDTNFRDKNIGSSLIRHYLMVCCPNTSSQLWVATDNTNAKLRYHHYGYSALDLSDQIMIRK